MYTIRRSRISLAVFILIVGTIQITALDRNVRAKEKIIETPTTPPNETVTQDFRGFEMVYIPGGKMDMGITSNGLLKICTNVFQDGDECSALVDEVGKESGIFQVHTVNLQPFWIDRFEVTVEQYEQCITAPFLGCRQIVMSYNPLLTDNPKKPRTGVNWYDAVLFCNTRQARLPSEAEWEYAAKGTKGFNFPWGNSLLDYYQQSQESPHPIGAIPENVSWAGVYDLSGNVQQWVEDRFQPYLSTKTGAEKFNLDDTKRVVRGGSWIEKGFKFLSAYRSGSDPNSQHEDIGFRCARTTDPRN